METQENNTERKLSSYGEHNGGYWIYVGTYAKYNNGNLAGAWLNLEDFADKDDFYDYCNNVLHKDESDPELMFQDVEGIPSDLYAESSISERIWELAAFDDHERNIIKSYLAEYDAKDFQEIIDSYCGEYSSVEDYARSHIEDCYNLDKMMGNLACYFDYESFARDLELNGDIKYCDSEDGNGIFVFNND
jgi:antirestriction protein